MTTTAVGHGTLRIVRNTSNDIQDRWVRVSIDGAAEEILRYGETLVCELPAGVHRVKAHNTLSKDAIEVNVPAGGEVRVRCHNGMTKGGPLLMLTIGFSFIKVRLEVL